MSPWSMRKLNLDDKQPQPQAQARSRNKGARNKGRVVVLPQTGVRVRKSKDSPAAGSSPHGGRVRKSKDCPAAGSPPHVIHGTSNKAGQPEASTSLPHEGHMEREERLAKMRALRDWCKNTVIYYNPIELRDDPGAKALESEDSPTCPHEGNEDSFSFMFCKPHCKQNGVTDFPFSICAVPFRGGNPSGRPTEDMGGLVRMPNGRNRYQPSPDIMFGPPPGTW